MASLIQWTWVWANSRSCWWTGRPGVLWFMELQRVGHDWVTELNWTVVHQIPLSLGFPRQEYWWSEVKLLSHVWLFAIPWIEAYQTHLSLEFSRKEYWSGLPFPSPEDLPDSGIKPEFPALAGRFFTAEPLGKPKIGYTQTHTSHRWRRIKHTVTGKWIENGCLLSVQFSRSVVSDFLWPHESQHARPPCPSPAPGVHPKPHCVDDAIQPSHPLSSPSLPALNLSQHQGLFKWVSSLHQVAKVLEFQLQHQSFQWTPRTDLL